MISHKKNNPQKTYIHYWALDSSLFQHPIIQTHGKKLKETSMPKFQQAIHLCFHFAGTTTSTDDTYDPKMYV